MTDPKMGSAAADRGIRWHFHPSRGSSHGGHYERLIKSCRSGFRGLTNGETKFLVDNFSTVLAEVEKVLNDRPLVPVSDDVRDGMALTPNSLLLLRSNTSVPISEDMPARKVFTQANEIADEFWQAWIADYIPQLIARQKCLTPQRNLRVDDVCLMAGEQKFISRGQWPLCVVAEVTTDADGLVRRVRVKTLKWEYERPINKLALLEGSK